MFELDDGAHHDHIVCQDCGRVEEFVDPLIEDRQKAIFEAFEQANAATTTKFGGTGLGTAIASQLVELMGGRISLASQDGKGSLFRVSIPCQTCSAVEPGQQRPLPDLSGVRTLMLASEVTALSLQRKLDALGVSAKTARDRRFTTR